MVVVCEKWLCGMATVVAALHHKINQFFIVGQIAPIIYKTI
jgi:hypothetical protein